MVNPRTKGAEGEREVAKIMNGIVATVREQLGLEPYAKLDEIFQRNQNQSAVGGADFTNPLKLEIEVKRQQALSINSWWDQCTTSAARTGGIPILIFRQNGKKWRVCMEAEIPLLPASSERHLVLSGLRCEIDLDTFKLWFHRYYKEYLKTWYADR